MSYVEDLDKANMRINQLVDEIHDRAAVEADLRHRADTAEAKLGRPKEVKHWLYRYLIGADNPAGRAWDRLVEEVAHKAWAEGAAAAVKANEPGAPPYFNPYKEAAWWG